MNKEEILRTFLEDDSLVEKGYLKEGEAAKFRWTDRPDNKLINVLREVVTGEGGNESTSVIERKINQIFNR